MDKIYSRRKIDLKNLNINNFKNNKKIRRILKVLTIIIIAIITVNVVVKSITPIIDMQCKNIAKSIATKISNEQATNVMKNYKYDDLCNITKDPNGNVSMISSNVITINEIISDIPIKIQDELNNSENTNFKIKLGSFTGSKILSGTGPDVKIRMSTIGNVETNLKSNFISAGINQTLHKIYLEVKCNVTILTPFNTMEESILNQVLLAEAVVIGTTPNTYYNFEGMNSDSVIEVVD